MIRYNSSSGVQDIEAYINNAWTSLTTGGTTASITLGTSALTPNPASSFSNTTGLFSPASGIVGITSAGTEKLRVTGTSVGIGTATPNASAVLDTYSTTQGVLLPRLTTTQMNAVSSPAAGLTIYNTTANQLYSYNGTAWVADSLGGGQLLGVYSSGTAVTNNTIVFTGAAGSAPSFSGTTLTLASNTAYITVEMWGAGGGGGGSGSGAGNGGTGSTSYFCEVNSSCASNGNATFYATGGLAGGSGGSGGGSGGGGVSGDINLSGGGGAGTNYTNASSDNFSGGLGGYAPLGGGPGPTVVGATSGVGAYGGGGSGGGINSVSGGVSGAGGGGGGYVFKFINNPSGTYYYSIGGGNAGGTAGTSGAAGVASGAGA